MMKTSIKFGLLAINKIKNCVLISGFQHPYFKDQSFFFSNNRIYKRPTKQQANEYIQLQNKVRLQPSSIMSRTHFVPYTQQTVKDALQPYCRYSCINNSLQVYKPAKFRFCDELIDIGISSIFIYINFC